MSKKEAIKKTCLQPVPKVLVSCRDSKGNDNALVVAYCSNCSYDPPMVMVGIVPSRYSYDIIKNAKCFVVNLVTEDLKKEFDYLGSHSGRDEDKISKMNMKVEDGLKVNAPILSDCPINIECSIVDSIVTGSHEMFVGKVEYVHANEELVDNDGKIDYSKLKFI